MKFEDLQFISDSVHNYWDGIGSIILMREHDYQWKQMEWAGWYFQLLIKSYNDGRFVIPGKKFINSSFDTHLILGDFPIDVKVHSNKTSKGVRNKKVQLNDRDSTLQAIDQYGKVGVIVACGDFNFDVTGEFKSWHDNLKGEKSAYCKKAERENKNSRMRKTSVNLTHIDYYEIDNNNVDLLGHFQEGFKNSNDAPRKCKFELDVTKIAPIYTITK